MLKTIEQSYKDFRRENFNQCLEGFVIVIGLESLMELVCEVEIGKNFEGECLYINLYGEKRPLIIEEKLPLGHVKFIEKNKFIVGEYKKLDKRLKAMF